MTSLRGINKIAQSENIGICAAHTITIETVDFDKYPWEIDGTSFGKDNVFHFIQIVDNTAGIYRVVYEDIENKVRQGLFSAWIPLPIKVLRILTTGAGETTSATAITLYGGK